MSADENNDDDCISRREVSADKNNDDDCISRREVRADENNDDDCISRREVSADKNNDDDCISRTSFCVKHAEMRSSVRSAHLSPQTHTACVEWCGIQHLE